MADASGTTPRAGWYPDALDSSQLRWWNGVAWTADVRSRSPLPTELAAAHTVTTGDAPTRARTRREVREQYTASEILDDEHARLPAANLGTARPYGTVQALVPPWQHTVAAVQPEMSVAQHYVPMSSIMNVSPAATIIVPGNAQSISVWLIALSPIWLSALSAVIGFIVVTLVGVSLPSIALWAAAVVPVFFLARMDVAALRLQRYQNPASAWWVFLAILGYLIARAVKVGRRGIAPILVYLVMFLGVVAVSVATALSPAVVPTPHITAVANTVPLTAAERVAQLTVAGSQTELMKQLNNNGGINVGTVTCKPFQSTDAASTTTCTAQLDGIGFTITLLTSPDDLYNAFGISSEQLTPN